MIFVTVGHQTPFDRLVEAMDRWAESSGHDCLAQIGDGRHEPRHMRFSRWMSPQEFQQAMEQADAIVAHAGTGTILTAMQLGKPVLVLPRHSSRQETRNDHQIATARHFAAAGHVLVAHDEAELPQKLPQLLQARPTARIGGVASDELLAAVRTFVFGDRAAKEARK